MHNQELPTTGLHGTYRDVLYDQSGRVTWDRGWGKNVIEADCRRLLAALMAMDTAATPTGIVGVKFGQGDPSWDNLPGGPPLVTPTTPLIDPNPYEVKRSSANQPVFQYIVPGTTDQVSVPPTNTLQIVATIGVDQPLPLVGVTFREFALYAQINGADVLVNLVRHVAIIKDPTSILVRTIQLVF